MVLLALVTSAVGCGDFGYADPNGRGSSSGSSSGRTGDDGESISSGTLGTATRVASDERGPTAIAVHDGTIYVANLLRGTIKRVSSGGGELKLIDGSSSPIAIAASSQGVFWVSAGTPASLYRFDPDDSDTTEIADGFSGAERLLATPQHVFVAGERSLVRVSTSGSSQRSILSGEALSGGIATDGSRVYWVDATEGELRSVEVDGSETRVVASGLDSPVHIALDSSSVYTVEQSSGSRIRKISKSSTTGKATYLASLEDEVTSLAAENGYVYWATTDGVVARVSTSGGATVQTLARNQQRPDGLTVASDGIYWVQTGTGAVMRIKR